jgi:hypothetical protein
VQVGFSPPRRPVPGFAHQPAGAYSQYHHISAQFLTLARVDSTAVRIKRPSLANTGRRPMCSSVARWSGDQTRLAQDFPAIAGRNGLSRRRHPPIRAWPLASYTAHYFEGLVADGCAVAIGLSQALAAAGGNKYRLAAGMTSGIN